ncbi:MAG TPA: hypothetical protein VK253_02620, partial [Candidatus Binatia bacterium]|nr:hypothetical protein [Candidatus Binatia bacterium]
MPWSEPSRFFLFFWVAVLVLGLALVPFLLLQPNLQVTSLSFRRPLVGAIYGAVCIGGMLAVFYPGKCRMMFRKLNVSPEEGITSASSAQLKGHHP